MIVDLGGSCLSAINQSAKGIYIHSWRELVKESIRTNSPIVIRNWRPSAPQEPK